MSEFEFWKDIGNISDAILNYQKKNAEFNNRFINPWIRLGLHLDRQDRDEEIVRAHQHATEIDPETAQNWIDLGDVHLKMGAYEDAVIAYRKAVALTPQAGWPLSNLALSLVMQGKYEEAIPLYIASIELLIEKKDKVVSLNRLGDAYRKLNDYEKAFLSFQKADELDGNNVNMGNQTNELLDNISKNVTDEIPGETAIEQFREYENVDDDPLTNFDKPIVQTTQDEVEYSMVDTAADKNQSKLEVETVDIAAGTQMRAEKVEAAETLGGAAAKMDEMIPNWLSEEHKNNLGAPGVDPKNPRVPEWLIVNTKDPSSQEADEAAASAEDAEIMTGQLNHPKATDAERQAVILAEDLKEDVASQGPSADVLGKHSDENAYEEYLKDVVEPMTILSDHMDEIHSQPPSGNTSEMLTAMESKNAQVWNELGNMYLKSGSCDDAIASYSKAIELERHFAWPYSNLALAYVEKGYFAEAILLYQRSIELFTSDKDKAVSWNRLGNVYRRMNDYDNAIAAYQTADEFDPENSTLSLRSSFGLLGNLYAEQKSSSV